MIALWLLGCTQAPPCPGGWDAVDGACERRLPDTRGVPGDGAPEPLGPADLSEAEQLALAERFQPAQVFAGDQLWPTEVGYCYRSGADLVRHTLDDTDYSRGEVAVPSAGLPSADLSDQPAEGFVYGVDCPGDNTSGAWDDATWFDAWEELQGGAEPAFPPVHYVHLAWFDRSADLLLVQYWFYYPYDKFMNNHEGDWEHVNVVVDVSGEPALRDVHFHFHGDSMRAVERITRITDAAGGDHPVVFVGGCAELQGYGGCYSGASYPWPGQYDHLVFEDTTPQARLLHPDDIGVILLPEREAASGAEIGWLALDVYFGQWRVEANSALVLFAGGYSPPTQPAYKGSWNRPAEERWEGEASSTFTWFEPPPGWEVLYNPGHDDGVTPP